MKSHEIIASPLIKSRPNVQRTLL